MTDKDTLIWICNFCGYRAKAQQDAERHYNEHHSQKGLKGKAIREFVAMVKQAEAIGIYQTALPELISWQQLNKVIADLRARIIKKQQEAQ